ncbi:hypothetical protein J4462_01060 [Candidatus Pacearchaeota archaeon]|nr:hypothetical protein [Candidatus Pacearchaeota archaeon]
MRKIGSEEDTEKKKKRNMSILGVFLLAILVLGTVGYGFLAGPGQNSIGNTQELEEGVVTNLGQAWAVRLGEQTFQFSNSLESTQNISVNITSSLQDFTGQPLYIDSTNTAANTEIAQVLGRFASRMQEACLDSCPNRNVPEKNCTSNMIIWRDNIKPRIYQEEKCIFIEGDLQAADAFLYEILGLKQ